MKIFIIITILAIVAYYFLNIGKEKPSSGNYPASPSVPQSPPPVPDWEATWHPTCPVKASGKCGANVNWAFYEDGQLIITGNGSMYDYYPDVMVDSSHKAAPWCPYRASIKSIKVGKGITDLGDWVFSFCENLEDVSLSCSTRIIPWGCFHACEKLQQIEIPSSVKIIGTYCFEDCYSLQTVKLPYGIKEIGDSAFMGCRNLVNINFPESIVNIDEYSFAHCPNLKHIRIPRSTAYISKKAFFNSGVNIPPRGSEPI